MSDPAPRPPAPPPLPEITIDPDQRAEFSRPPAANGIPWALGGLACAAAAAFGLFVALRTDVDPITLQFMTTMPLLGSLPLFGKAFLGRRGLRKVIADEQGLTLHYHSRIDTIPWTRISWNSEGVQVPSNLPQSTLYDDTGKVLAKIPSTLIGWDNLIQRINRRVKGNANAAAELVRRKKLRRQGFLLLGFCIFGVIAASFLTYAELDKHRRDRLLESSAIQGTATVERKFTAPNGRTRRIEYRVDTAPDQPKPELVNVEVEPLLWDTLADGQKIPVLYVPANPDVSRLSAGQRDDDVSGGKTVVVIVLFFILLIFFLIAGILNLRGIDIVQDSQTKKFRIARSVAR